MIHQTFQRSLLPVQRKKENRLYPHSNSLPDSPLTVRKKARENIRGSSIGSRQVVAAAAASSPSPPLSNVFQRIFEQERKDAKGMTMKDSPPPLHMALGYSRWL